MGTEFLSGQDLVNMLQAGLACLEDRHKEVDSLNVFPVPDGDTGTNMFLTLSAAVQEAAKTDTSSIGNTANSVSRGALMGARGNSGVILSQLLRGLALGLKNMDRVSGKVFAEALLEGVKVAYKAVTKPVEGTILTVAKEAAKAAVAVSVKHSDVEQILEAAYRTAEDTLDLTPEMLPALKEAGVVDAGGMGWVIILKGFYEGISGNNKLFLEKRFITEKKAVRDKNTTEQDFLNPYCTELLIKANNVDLEDLKGILKTMGDSLIAVEAEGYTKVHLHTARPGKVLEACLDYGVLSDIKINNMIEQAAEAAVKKSKKPFGILSVALGQGIKQVMESLGADKVIAGGQTMNPSTQELLEAVEEIPAETIVVLPNNKNIIMTANQVKKLTKKQVHVIPTITIPQAFAALLTVKTGQDVERAIKGMTEAAGLVKTVEVTYAVRDTKVNGTVIKESDIIGLYDDEIVETGINIPQVVINLLKKTITSDNEVCTLYSGEMVAKPDADKLLEQLENHFTDIEFEIIEGGQPLYYYIISIE